MSNNIQQSFEAHAEGECQARHAVETVKDAAGAILQTGEQVAQATQNAAAAAKDAVAGGTTCSH